MDPLALTDVLARIAESVAVYEADGRVVYANPPAERLLGKSLPELAGKILWDLYPNAIDPAFQTAFERVVATGSAEELDHYCAAFDRWWASSLTWAGARVHVVSREVTDQLRSRRRAEALARISEVLAEEADFARVTRTIADILTDVLDADCSLAMLSEDREWLDLGARTTRDDSPDTSGIRRISAKHGHPEVAIRTRAPVLADLSAIRVEGAKVQEGALRTALESYQPTSLLVVPLLADDTVTGVVMAVRRGRQRALTHVDRELATAIAPTVALYLAHARRRDEATSLRNRLTAVTDSNHALVSLVDRDQRYVYVNASYTRWFDRPPEHFVGKTILQNLGEVAYAPIRPYVERALAGEEVHYQTAVQFKNGERIIDSRYVPIRSSDGTVEAFAALVFDVTAEHALAQAEQRRIAEERRATLRLQSLLALTGRLAGTASEEVIVEILVDEGMSALDALLAGLWLARDEDTFTLVRERSIGSARATAVSLVEPAPLAECIRTAKPVWTDAHGIVPLVIEGRTTGIVSFAFDDQRQLTADDRTYLELLASHGAQALRRARLYAALGEVSEAREAMIQALPAAILVIDEEVVVRAWNPAAERIFGWSASEVIGQVLPWVDRTRSDYVARSLLAVLGGAPLHDARMRWPRRSGELLDIELYAVPVADRDGRTRCLAMAFDVTERMRGVRGRALVTRASALFSRSLDVDETLRQMLQLPLEQFADWSFVDLIDEDGTLARVMQTRQTTRITSLPGRLAHSSELDGASRAITTRAPRLLRDIDDATLQRIARDPAHLEALRAMDLRSSLSLPLVIGDRILGALSIASCSTNYDEIDVRIFEDLASHAAGAIENARLYRAAQQARRDAESADRAKDQFLAMLGHELRNPLAPIMTALHLMKMRQPNVSQRERAVIDRQVSHLARLVDDLLDISRITRGKIELHRERVPVGAVIARALEITSPLFEQRRHRLSLDVPQDLVIDGDPTRLDQVLANLMSNAAKYTEAGGQIQVSAKLEGDTVVLSVKDSGVGIAPEMLPTIFEVFAQSPQPSAREAGGLGLGLAIVKSIVELHGGTVRAHSAGLGQGAELVVTLPAMLAPPGTERISGTHAAVVRRTGMRILVVDDNRDAATMLSEVLDSYGHEVGTAYDGPTSLVLAAQLAPELAVLDIGLPVMDGYELAARLRIMFPQIRLIAVTGYGQASDRERARQAGFEAHVAKPVPMDKLIELIDDSPAPP